VSPFRQAREQVRKLHGSGRFIEVFVSCPLAELIKRDQKDRYARAMRGEIANFTGISDPYEPPVNPQIIVHTNSETIEQSFKRITDWWKENSYLTNKDEQAVSISNEEFSFSAIST